jgi:hypothetical protein
MRGFPMLVCILLKCRLLARNSWLMPVILATWEAEIRRIVIWSQLPANSSRDPIYKIIRAKNELVAWLKQ